MKGDGGGTPICCELSCAGLHARESLETFSTFALPRGVRMLRARPSPASVLGRTSHSWLPVTHVHARQDPHQVGIWFYYARGCSDLAWNVGETLLVRNRCDAVIGLEAC